MSRYIDADELYVDWYDSFVADDGTEYDNIPFISKGQIDDAPTIDIVHCHECKWSDWYTAGNGERYCYCLETDRGGYIANDFCSYGERETDE